MIFDDFEPKAKKAKIGRDEKMDMQLRLQNPDYLSSLNSKTPQAIVKVIKDSPRGSNVRNAMRYIARAIMTECNR